MFQRPRSALALWARALLLVFEKFIRAYLFQIALKIMWLPILISCFSFQSLCPRETGSSFERFEFARYLPPFSSCETGTNMSRVWQEILFPRFAKCLGHQVPEGLTGRSLIKESSFGHSPRDHPADGVQRLCPALHIVKKSPPGKKEQIS